MHIIKSPPADFDKIVTGTHQSIFWKNAICKQFRRSYHYHPECELIYIRRGYGRRWVGRSITHFGPGEMVFIPPNIPHMWQAALECPQAEVFYVQFRPDFAGEVFINLPEMHSVKNLLSTSCCGVTFSASVSKEIASRLEHFRTLNPSERLLSLLDILYRLSLDSHRHHLDPGAGGTGINQRQEERISKVFQYINQHLTEPISQAEIARRVNLSPAAFSRLFKKTTRKCFMEVVNELRVAQVCHLLAETNGTITEIAYKCGYETLSHFNSTFLRITGTTPSRYRRLLDSIHR